MNIETLFVRAVSPQTFHAHGSARYARNSHGPFVAQRYVPKPLNGDPMVEIPQSVWVDANHAQAQEAREFVGRKNRDVRRALDRGTSVAV